MNGRAGQLLTGVRGPQGSETSGTGSKNRVDGDPGSEKGRERYVHRGGLPTWAGKRLGTCFSVPFSPAATGRFSSGFAGGTPISTRTAVSATQVPFAFGGLAGRKFGARPWFRSLHQAVVRCW
jgi:hypothetical protein